MSHMLAVTHNNLNRLKKTNNKSQIKSDDYFIKQLKSKDHKVNCLKQGSCHLSQHFRALLTKFRQHGHVHENLQDPLHKKHPSSSESPTLTIQPHWHLAHPYQNCLGEKKKVVLNQLL